jgi:hypothetical protein
LNALIGLAGDTAPLALLAGMILVLEVFPGLLAADIQIGDVRLPLGMPGMRTAPVGTVLTMPRWSYKSQIGCDAFVVIAVL